MIPVSQLAETQVSISVAKGIPSSMWLFAFFAVIGLTAATLWFTVWAERELLAAAASDDIPEADMPEADVLVYILAATAPGPDAEFARTLERFAWVEDVSTVGGPYDVIIRVRDGVLTRDALADLENVPGILRILPCHAAKNTQHAESRPSASSRQASQ